MRKLDFLFKVAKALKVCRFEATELHAGYYGIGIYVPVETDEEYDKGVSYDFYRGICDTLGFELQDDMEELLNEPGKLYDYYVLMTFNKTLFTIFDFIQTIR